MRSECGFDSCPVQEADRSVPAAISGFQDPGFALVPKYSVGSSLRQTLRLRFGCSESVIPRWNRDESAIRLRRTFGVLMFARKDETSRCASRPRNPRPRNPRLRDRRQKIGCRLLPDAPPIVFSVGGSCSDLRSRTRGRSLGGWWRRRRLWRQATFAAVRCADRASTGIAGKGRSSDTSCLCRLERPDAKSVNTRDAGVGDKSIRCLFYGCVAHYNTST